MAKLVEHKSIYPILACRDGHYQPLVDPEPVLAELRYKTAMAAWKKDPTSANIEALAKAHNELGVRYVADKNYDLGIRHINEALRLMPDQIQCIANLAGAYFLCGKFIETINYCTKLQKLDPKCPWAFYYLGKVSFFNGNIDKAIEHLSKAVKFNPEKEIFQKLYQEALASKPPSEHEAEVGYLGDFFNYALSFIH